jgi:hypothetical protein
MVYQRHNVWEDEDKWDIHKSSYRDEKYHTIKNGEKGQVYKNEEQYGAAKKEEEGIKNDYIKKEEEEEKEKEKDHLVEAIEQEEKYKKNETDELPLQNKATEEILQEIKDQPRKFEKKRSIKTIEDAINNAIREEKKVIALDR